MSTVNTSLEGCERGPKVYLHYDQASLDAAYDQKVWAGNAAEVMERYSRASAAVRSSHGAPRSFSYGHGPDENLDVFVAAQPDAPIHFHIHGGGWRSQRKEDVSFPAPAFNAANFHYIVPDFSALPQVKLPFLVDQLARALAWVYKNAQTLGVEAQSIYLSGHSSGAHLCAVLLTLDWSRYGLPPEVIKGALCISGMYDMEPVLLSARRAYVSLTDSEAMALSPARSTETVGCPVTVVYAQYDSPEFIRQAEHFSAMLSRHGKLADFRMIPEVNHFEIVGKIAELAIA